ncbi:MAG: hypothetical protein ACE5F8_01685 [Woeseiaceae bacterium]
MTRRTISLLVTATLIVSGAPARAAELLSVSVDKKDGLYYVVSEVWMDVAQAPVYDVFADWDVATEFSSFIVESRNVGPDEDGVMGFYINNRGCVLFFCKSVIRAGVVESEPYHTLRAIADPEESDFEISEEIWTFRREDNGTVVRYENIMKPKFWIPPLIGPYLMKRKLTRDGGDAMDRIENIAREWETAGD